MMSEPSDVLDRLRRRWEEAREALRLADPVAEDFGTAGFARFVTDPSTCLLILPADPAGAQIEFDDDCWSWWLEDRVDPITTQPSQWGHHHRPTVNAAIRGWRAPEQQWYRYLALHRSGGMELELGDHGGRRNQQGRVSWLIRTVGRIWAALELYGQVIERFSVVGPWEIAVALRDTKNAVLANFGEGWAEPGSSIDPPPRAVDPGILIRREVADWPHITDVQALSGSDS